DVGISSRSINDKQGADGIAPIRIGKNTTHTAQVALTLFTHIANEYNISCWPQASLFERRADCKHRHDAGGVVADSRPVELIAFLSRSEQRARWKNCIQVRAYSDHWRLPIVIKEPEDVAQFVRLNLTKSEFVKAVAQPFAPCSFAEWWRGNLRQFHLPAAEFHLL